MNESKMGIPVKGITPFLFILPILIGTGIFSFSCLLYVIRLSFLESNLFGSSAFIGLKNYYYLLFESEYFYVALIHTLYYASCSVPLNLFVGLSLGFAMYSKIKYGSFFRFVYLIPWVSSGVIVALIFKYAFSPHWGIVNWFLGNLGFEKIRWFKQAETTIPIAAMMEAWQTMGLGMIIFLGAINSIPKNLSEAASLEGASTLQIIRYIILPLIKPTIFFYLVFCFINAFQVFNVIYIFMQGVVGPDDAMGLRGATLTSAYFTYILAFRGSQFGRASATAILMFLIMLSVLLIQRRFIGREITPL